MANRTNEKAIRRIISSYRSPIIRLYSTVRFSILRQSFLEEIGRYLPARGRILDIGCGFGLFSLYFAALEPDRRIVGLDSNERRVDFASLSAAKLGLANVTYHVGDAKDVESDDPFDAIYLLDLIHHLPKEDVPAFLGKLRALLVRDGTLVVKDVEDRPRWKVWFTLLLDRLMVGRGPIHYWPEAELSSLLSESGFEVRRHRMRDFLPYPHILYICRAI